MSAPNKIKKFQLEERTRVLETQGHKHYEIADILTQELSGKGSISQATVSRFLKDEKSKRESVARVVMENYVEATLPGDLKLLDEIMGDWVILRRNESQKLHNLIAGIKIIANGKEVEFSEKRLAFIDEKLHEILRTKFRFVGVGGDGEGKRYDPVDFSKYRLSDDDRKEMNNGS